MSVETTVVVAKPVINLRLFTIRIITAVSLFAVLGKANVWLDTATNSILALGYRALLLLLPLTLLVLGRRSLSVTLLCAAGGWCCWRSPATRVWSCLPRRCLPTALQLPAT